MRPSLRVVLVTLCLSASALAVPPSHRTAVVVRGVPAPGGSVAITIENRGQASVSLSTNLRLERLQAGRWATTDLAPSALELREECERPLPTCRTLAPGERLRVVAWSGYNALIQCPRPTPSDFPAPAGRYRVSATSCDGAQVYVGIPFARAEPVSP
jgi:hypothetical protein